MTKPQLKQLIRECIKEVNESFGVYQGQSTPLRSFYNKIKNDPIVKKNRINVDINDDQETEPVYRIIYLKHNTFDDFWVDISAVGKNKYKVEIPYFGKDQYDPYDPTIGRAKAIVTDEKGVMRIIYAQIKNKIG